MFYNSGSKNSKTKNLDNSFIKIVENWFSQFFQKSEEVQTKE
jgi:hypothetical protein